MNPTPVELLYARPSDGFTLLHLVITSHNPYLVALYSYLGADINARAVGEGVAPCGLIAKTGHLVKGMVSAFGLSKNYLKEHGLIEDDSESHYMEKSEEKIGFNDGYDSAFMIPRPTSYEFGFQAIISDDDSNMSKEKEDDCVKRNSNFVSPERPSSPNFFEELEGFKDAFEIPEDVEYKEGDHESLEERAEDEYEIEVLAPKVLVGSKWVQQGGLDESKEVDSGESLLSKFGVSGAALCVFEMLEGVKEEVDSIGVTKEDDY